MLPPPASLKGSKPSLGTKDMYQWFYNFFGSLPVGRPERGQVALCQEAFSQKARIREQRLHAVLLKLEQPSVD